MARPEEVTYTPDRLRYNTAYWVRIDALSPHHHYGHIQAQVVKGPSQHVLICVKRDGVDAYTLLLDRAPVDPDRPLKVVDGQDVVYDGAFRPELHLPQESIPADLAKRRGLSGPIEDVFHDPFLYVYSTGAQADSNRSMAQRATDWGRVKHTFSVKADTSVTERDIAHYHLILYGRPHARSLLSGLLDRLPVSFSEDAITVNGQSFSGEGLGAQMIYPNPLNRERYLVLNWGMFDMRVDQSWDTVVFRRTEDGEISYELKVNFDNAWRLPEPEVIGEAISPLLTWASIRAQALLQASRVDVALVPEGGTSMPLRKDAIAVQDILARTDGQPIFTFQANGEALLAMLEHGLSQGRSFEVAGASYIADTTRAAGRRVVQSTIDANTLYTVAVEAITAILADRTLGQSVDYVPTEMIDTDAMIGYIRHTWRPEVPNR